MNGGSRPDENPISALLYDSGTVNIDTTKQYKGATRNRFQILTKIYLETNQPETISESLAWFTRLAQGSTGVQRPPVGASIRALDPCRLPRRRSIGWK